MVELDTAVVERVVAALPEEAKEVLIRNDNTVVAGGFIRDTLRGRTPSDVDVFTTKDLSVDQFEYGRLLATRAARSKRAVFYEWTFPNRPAIQVIKVEPDHVEKRFDFTCCCAKISGYDGRWGGLAHESFMTDLNNHRLALLGPERINPRKTLKRVVRFVGEGFTINESDLAAIVAATVMGTKHAGQQFVSEEALREELGALLEVKKATEQPAPTAGGGFVDEYEVEVAATPPPPRPRPQFRLTRTAPQPAPPPMTRDWGEVVGVDQQPIPEPVRVNTRTVRHALNYAMPTLNVHDADWMWTFDQMQTAPPGGTQ